MMSGDFGSSGNAIWTGYTGPTMFRRFHKHFLGREIMNYKAIITAGIMGVASLSLTSASIGQEKDAGHNKDYRTFHADGNIDYGDIGDSYTSELVMYLAGNQFMVMEELIKDFQSKNSDIKTIYVETIPPGQILKGQILKQGKINDQNTAQNPDLFASVNLGHLKTLKGKKLMSNHIIYTHNKLELMVAEGNPKGIKGAADLGRGDLVQSHPNPLTEGIFKFYGSQMLRDLGIYSQVQPIKNAKAAGQSRGKPGLPAATTAKPRKGLKREPLTLVLSGPPR
jgi:hypothetical protein